VTIASLKSDPMPSRWHWMWRGRPALAAVALLSALMLGAALISQYVFGLAPCELCHWQRWAHIAAIALAGIGFVLAGSGRARGMLGGAGLALAGAALLAGAGIAGFHAGVELHWWEGTSACGGGTPDSLEALRAQIMGQPIVRCDEVAFSFAGISMAGWNGLLSLALAAAAAVAARNTLAEAGR